MAVNVGGYSTDNLVQWNIYRLNNGSYKIQNYDHNLFAVAESGYWAKQGDSVVGGSHFEQWKIMEMPFKGHYWCAFDHL